MRRPEEQCVETSRRRQLLCEVPVLVVTDEVLETGLERLQAALES